MIFKCKMCGGNLNIDESTTIAECEYCGTLQTIPIMNNDKKVKLFERANRFRFDCEFDKADLIYESIISEFPSEPEAYWGRILCKYGIEYVDDKKNGNKVPTCHRISYIDLKQCEEYLKILELSDEATKKIYVEEAEKIEIIREKSINISSTYNPYDIFICYKDTDENGNRTEDSVLAENIYDDLIGLGYNVFFSRVSLEDKLGVEYEPYIFSALNSSKVMLVIGTNYNYIDSIWVRNEWSRYIELMHKKHDLTLIPCIKGIDANELPKELSGFQALDLSKIGAKNDLIRGIKKMIPNGTIETSVSSQIKETIKEESKRKTKKIIIIACVMSVILAIAGFFGIRELIGFVENNKSTTIDNQNINEVESESEAKEDTINVEWQISDIIVNTEQEDQTTSLDSVPYGGSYIYIHYSITEGPEDEELLTECIGTDGNGEAFDMIHEKMGKKGDTQYFFRHWSYDNDGSDAPLPRGTYTFKIYNSETNELLGAKSITVN